MTKKKPELEENGSVCGGCKWYLAESDEQGHCFAMPPSVVSDDLGGVWAVRPTVDADEPQCMFFQNRLNS